MKDLWALYILYHRKYFIIIIIIIMAAFHSYDPI